MILKAFKRLNVLNINDIYTFSLCTYVFSLSNISVFSQDNSNTIQNESLALENVIVEEYFIPASKYFLTTDSGAIPRCSITYKIYIEMKPGYSFQLIYGKQKNELFIKTSTKFQDNKVCRAITGFNINPKKNYENKVDADSWITMGSATRILSEIIKADSKENSIISENILDNDQNFFTGKHHLNNPLKFELHFFNDRDHANEFNDKNGNQDTHPDNNLYYGEGRILIAQLTTKEKLNFELKVESGNFSTDFQQYVPDNTNRRAAQTVNFINN